MKIMKLILLVTNNLSALINAAKMKFLVFILFWWQKKIHIYIYLAENYCFDWDCTSWNKKFISIRRAHC